MWTKDDDRDDGVSGSSRRKRRRVETDGITEIGLRERRSLAGGVPPGGD